MKVQDIADEVYRELDSPTALSIPAIAYWLRVNIGALNNLIHANFYINSTTLEIEHVVCDVVTEINEEEKAILKKMYLVHYYDVQLRASLGAASTDGVLEVSSDGSTVRKINKNELSKTYSFVRRQENADLDRLVTSYKSSLSTPRQVAGDATVEGVHTPSTTTYHRTKHPNN